MRNLSSRNSLVTVAVLAAGVVAGLAFGTHTQPVPASADHAPHHDHVDSDQEPLDYAVSHLRDRFESGAGFWIERRLSDLLPNRQFTINGAAPRGLSNGVVVGTVTSVDGGAGYAVAGPDADNGTVVAFDAEDALWRVAELTVSISDGFGVAPGETEVRIALPFDGREDRAKIMQGFENQRVIVALAPQGSVQHDASLYSIAHGGGAIGFVSEQDEISLPVMGEMQAGFLDGLDTVREVRRQSQAPKKTLQVVIRGGIPHVQQ